MNKITNNESKQKLSLTPIESQDLRIGLGVAHKTATQMMLQSKLLHKKYHKSKYEVEKLKQYLASVFPVDTIRALMKPSGIIDDNKLVVYCEEAFQESNYNLFIPNFKKDKSE